MFSIRKAVKTSDDLMRVQKLDLQCFTHSWEEALWRDLIQKRFVWLGLDHHKPLGYWVGGKCPIRPDEFRLARLGISNEQRYKGYASKLLEHAEGVAKMRGFDTIVATLPEFMFYSHHPENIAGWLKKMQFQTTGEVKRDFFLHFGDKYDGFDIVKILR